MLFSIRKLQRVNHALEQETLGRIGNIFRSKAKPVLRLADISLTVLHLVVIGFNLFGWIWPRTRRAHLIVVAATAFCWLVPGIRFGIGYCPITDWQWQVKAKLGEHHLPPSFITWALSG
jgi:hypothetical protein